MHRFVASALVLLVLVPAAALGSGQTAVGPVAAAQEFVNLMDKGEFKACEKRLDDEMKQAAPASRLREIWAEWVSQVGPLEKQVRTRVTKQEGYDLVFVTCRFRDATWDVRVVLDSKLRVAGLFRSPGESAQPYVPPSYVKADAFTETEVTVGAGEWALPGTLTMPRGKGPFPAVILVHGSGPHDRDETIGPNKPFRDLAHGLASRQIAVMRYEKRTKHHNARMAAMRSTITMKEETVDDALAAAQVLRRTAGLDPRRLFVLGHSQGGMLIPRIGVRDPGLAGFIVFAGCTRPLEDVLVEQVTYIAGLDGQLSDLEKSQLMLLRKQVARVKDPKLSPKTRASELPLGLDPVYWLDLRGYRPAEAARALAQPMLVLQGGRDYQVTGEDFALWKSALADRKNVQLKLYPDLNHLFATGKGKATPAEYNQPSHVAPAVIQDIADWVASVK